MKHINIKVTGKVQGVWYRDSTKRKARELGINGIVRNEPGGSVYIEAEGNEEALDELVQWCRKGPEQAAVQTVKVTEGKMENYDGFHVTCC